ncbi:MAG TPA: hypothetical protein VJB57_08880 [Dehalococcoidia bacterium]|nr:hypothetical protein [Dehalococcoidia bacterium]
MLDTLVDLALDTPEEEDGWERESFHILFIEDAADLGMQPWEPVDIDAALEELRSRGLAAPFPETDAWAAAGKGQRLVLAVRNLPL